MPPRRRNPPSHPRRSRRQARPTPPSAPAPLLVIDQKPILKKALTECRRLRTELNKKQARLRRFEEEELPAYQRWFNLTFGAGLTEIRELSESVADHEFVFEQLRYCEMWMPEKLVEVHAELMRRLKERTLHAFVPPEPDEAETDDEDDQEDDDPFDDLNKAFEEAFKEFFGYEEDDEEDHDEPGTDGWGRRESKPGAPGSRSPHEAALKTLYRTLAKRLHPDHSDLEEGLRKRRWNELQAAYNAQDLDALQRIEAVCDMEDAGGLSIRLGLARLRDLAAYHRSHVKPIRQALRQAKRHPGFDFTKTDKAALRRDVEAELDEQRDELLDRLHWLRSAFADINEDVAACEPPTQAAEEATEDGDDFWDSYTAWRDEELSRSTGR